MTTFTDSELDELVGLLRCEGTNEPVQAATAITYLRDRIEAAVTAERERCARAAVDFLHGRLYGPIRKRDIASAIMDEPK